jgi:thiamine transport system permease protein
MGSALPMKLKRLLPALLPLAAVLAFFVLPYIMAVSPAFDSRPGSITFAAIGPVLRWTVVQAFLSALAALALGLPGAWFLSSPGLEGSRWVSFVRALTGVPFALPPVLAVLGFILFFGNSGWLNQAWAAMSGSNEGPLRILYRPEAVILCHAFYNFPLVMRLAGDGLKQARQRYGATSASLGAGPLKAATTVFFPLALPSIAAASLLAFLYSFTSFAVVLVLGGGPGATTLAVEIYRYARLSLDFQQAAVLALLETAIAATVFGLYMLCMGQAANVTVNREPRQIVAHRRKNRRSVLWLLWSLLIAVLVIGPLAAIPLESFLSRATRSGAETLSLRWWLDAGNAAFPALGRSLVLAILAATIATGLGCLAALVQRPFSGLVGTLMVLPLASSGIVLGLGWLALYGRAVSRTLLSAALVQAVIALPFSYKSISEGFRELPRNVVFAAMTLGASPLKRFFTVELPLISPRLASAWAIAAALSLGELNAVLMLGLEWETLPLLIYRALGAYRYGQACAAGTLLLCAAMAMLWLADWFGGKNVPRSA